MATLAEAKRNGLRRQINIQLIYDIYEYILMHKYINILLDNTHKRKLTTANSHTYKFTHTHTHRWVDR